MVPILIPKDSFKALDLLCDEANRLRAGISPQNVYLFPSGRNSESHASGWHGMQKFIDALPLKKPECMKATSNRHRISSLYAELDVSPKDQEMFYKHMGHSADINENVYQNPPGIREVTTIGPQLLEMDIGNYYNLKIFLWLI